MMTNCPPNTLFTVHPENHLIVSLNGRWVIENRYHETSHSNDHAIFQTLVSLRLRPEIYQVISYSIATDGDHLTQITAQATGRYSAAQNLIFYHQRSSVLTGCANTVGVSLQCLAAVLEDDENQDSSDYMKVEPQAVAEPQEEPEMALRQAKYLVETYEKDGGFVIPVSSIPNGLRYESTTAETTQYLIFPKGRKIPAIKFVRSGKMTYEALLKGQHGLLIPAN